MIDRFGRPITYLRVSVTDRCNLRCFYCTPAFKYKPQPKENILTLEEIEHLCKIFADLGIRKIRFTGGEPFLRSGFSHLIKRVSSIDGIEEICITTNGVYLEDYVNNLVEAGVNRVNVSLDSLKRDVIKNITGFDVLDKIMSGIEKCKENGISLKLNVVVLKGVNDQEIPDFIMFSHKNGIRLRFIELMSTKINKGDDFYVTEKEIITALRKNYSVGYLKQKGVENVYSLSSPSVEFGIIPARTGGFCGTCNKIRLRSDGRLVFCLYSKIGVDLRGLIRKGFSDEIISQKIKDSLSSKPLEGAGLKKKIEARSMINIGG